MRSASLPVQPQEEEAFANKVAVIQAVMETLVRAGVSPGAPTFPRWVERQRIELMQEHYADR